MDIRGLTTDYPVDAANAHHYERVGDFDLAILDAQVARGAELEVMDKIAEDSGGHAFYNSNGLEHAMETA